MKFITLSRAKKVLMYGNGREGAESFRFLRRKFPHLKIDIYEDQPGASEKPDFQGYDVIVVSPGVPREKLGRVKKSVLTSRTELFFDNLPEERRRHVIGVTGTKGKSTTVKFIYTVLTNAGLRSAIGGNFGTPLLELYDDFLNGRYEWLVVEFSSYQLENLRTSPGYAIYLNLYPDHLDRHHTFARYRAAKENIFRFQQNGDVLIVPRGWKRLAGKRKALLAPRASADLFPEDSPLRAMHFLEDIGTVVLLAKLLKIPHKVIARTAAQFEGLPHRMEMFANRRGILFCDDAISTNPDSTLAAVRFFGKKLGSIILGGQDRRQVFSGLVEELKKRRVEIIVFPSEVSARIVTAAGRLGYEKHILLARDLKDAVRYAFQKTAPGKVALLSTAAPSYDNFKNFEEKGSLFKKYVKEF